MPARSLARAWPLLGLLLAAVGCMTPAQSRQDALLRVTHEYNSGLRWRRYEDVTAHLAAEEARRFLARTGELGDDFEMADDEVAAIEVLDGGLRAQVTVDFTWYHQRRSLLRQTRITEDWRYRDGRWLCVAQRRVHGDRFPLVAEPLAEATPPR